MPNYNYKPIEHQDENMLNLKQQWYRPNIDPKLLKDLSKRRNGPGWINTIAFFITLFVIEENNRNFYITPKVKEGIENLDNKNCFLVPPACLTAIIRYTI